MTTISTEVIPRGRREEEVEKCTFVIRGRRKRKDRGKREMVKKKRLPKIEGMLKTVKIVPVTHSLYVKFDPSTAKKAKETLFCPADFGH